MKNDESTHHYYGLLEEDGYENSPYHIRKASLHKIKLLECLVCIINFVNNKQNYSCTANTNIGYMVGYG